jgi:hypothetical protein
MAGSIYRISQQEQINCANDCNLNAFTKIHLNSENLIINYVENQRIRVAFNNIITICI